jgi:hypothetical protein
MYAGDDAPSDSYAAAIETAEGDFYKSELFPVDWVWDHLAGLTARIEKEVAAAAAKLPRQGLQMEDKFDLRAFIDSRTAETSKIQEARKRQAEQWNARDQFRSAVNDLHNWIFRAQQAGPGNPTEEDLANRYAADLLALLHLAEGQGLRPKEWSILPDARPEQANLKAEQEVAISLWRLACDGNVSDLTNAMQKLLRIKDDGRLTHAFEEWLPTKLAKAYDLTVGWKAAPAASTCEVDISERPAGRHSETENDSPPRLNSDQTETAPAAQGGPRQAAVRACDLTETERLCLQAMLELGARGKENRTGQKAILEKAGLDRPNPKNFAHVFARFRDFGLVEIENAGRRGGTWLTEPGEALARELAEEG